MCFYVTNMLNLNGWIKETSTLLYISFYHFLYMHLDITVLTMIIIRAKKTFVFYTSKNESSVFNMCLYDIFFQRA